MGGREAGILSKADKAQRQMKLQMWTRRLAALDTRRKKDFLVKLFDHTEHGESHAVETAVQKILFELIFDFSLSLTLMFSWLDLLKSTSLSTNECSFVTMQSSIRYWTFMLIKMESKMNSPR